MNFEATFHVNNSLRICFKHISRQLMLVRTCCSCHSNSLKEMGPSSVVEFGVPFDRLLYISSAELLLNSSCRDPGCFLNKDVLSFLYSL